MLAFQMIANGSADRLSAVFGGYVRVSTVPHFNSSCMSVNEFARIDQPDRGDHYEEVCELTCLSCKYWSAGGWSSEMVVESRRSRMRSYCGLGGGGSTTGWMTA